jgi:fumarate reductase subunit C
MHTESTARPTGYPWRMPAGWWLKNPRYTLYMLRELSAVFAALWVVLFLLQLQKLAEGPAGRAQWLQEVTSPGWIVFSLVAFLFVLYHAWTAFTATGTLVYLRLGKTATPAAAINGSMLVAWLVATIVIGIILLAPLFGIVR